ncbi:MAG: NOG1 family protein [Halobacteriales archaeon]
MIFESLPPAPSAASLLDQAFSRAARAGRAKSGVEAQDSMLLTASNVLSDNLENVVSGWPDLGAVHPFYRELAAATMADIEPDAGGLDALRGHLSEVGWAARKTEELGREYQGRLRGTDPETARKLRKQGFARMADVVEEVADDLGVLGDAAAALSDLPDIRPGEPTIVVAGSPNVGKSAFVNAVTRADNEVASYPFTTTGIHVGHVERDRVRYQLVDTPGLLDRPPEERNEVERRAASALEHVADAVLVLVDASETCGYPLADQLELRDHLVAEFPAPVLTACNKADLSTAVEADHYMSVTADAEVAGKRSADARRLVEPVEDVLSAAVEAIGHEPELPR